MDMSRQVSNWFSTVGVDRAERSLIDSVPVASGVYPPSKGGKQKVNRYVLIMQ